MTAPTVLRPFPNPVPMQPLAVNALMTRGNDNLLAAKINEIIGIMSNLQFGDSMNLDAFSRLRVSNPVGLFSVQQQYDLSPFLVEGGATGTGTAPAHNANTRMADLVVGAGTGVSFTQSYEYVPYQAGKSQLVFLSGLLGTGTASCIKDIGLFDTTNGIFLRQNGTGGLQFIHRTSTSGSIVNNAVEQTAWNLDTLNGSGLSTNPSGLTLDVTKVFILVIDAQFLAMGRVRIAFDIGGVLVPVHEFLATNLLAVPYMQMLTLPVAMLMSTTSAAGTCSFKCASVSSEGGQESPNAYNFSTLEQTVTAASGAATHILSLRPLTTFNSKTNRSQIRVDTIAIIAGLNPILWQLCIGTTFSAAPTFGAVAAGSSASEQSTAVGTLTAATLVIAQGYIASGATMRGVLETDISAKYPLTLDRAGAVRANGTLSLLVTGIGGTSACRATMNISEVR